MVFSVLVLCVVLGQASAIAFDLKAPGKGTADWEHAVKIQAFPGKNKVASGDTFQFYVVLTLAEGWHIYSLENPGDDGLPTEIILTQPPFTHAGPWQESSPRLYNDKVLERMVKVHFHRAEFSTLQSVPPDVSPGNYPIKGSVRFRACDNKVCTMPRELRFNSRIQVVSNPPS